MAIFKNVTSQKIAVYAHDTSADAPKTGDAANITAQISLDGGATVATNDTNPTELDATDAKGIYIFDMTQAETNADLVILSAVSVTSDVQIESIIIYTLPTWASAQVAQTGDSYALIGVAGSGLSSLATQTSVNDLPTNAELATALELAIASLSSTIPAAGLRVGSSLILNEDSTGWIEVSFVDKDGSAVVPTSASYKITDYETDLPIRASTLISALAATISIQINPSDTATYSTDIMLEKKILTVNADYGASYESNEEYIFYVKNLKYV